MPTQILKPQEAGAKTDIASQYPTSGEHWDKVDEATPDDASTYVRHNLTSYATDTYALPAGAGVGEIDSVKVVARCYGISGNYNYAKTVLRTHSNFYEGAAQQLSANWQNISTEYALNPYTNQPWTWAEVDALEAGVALKSSSNGEFFAICTQVYVEVTYHTETPKTSADAGSGAESLPAQANIIAGTDSGSGAMASSPTASFARAENGSSVEALSFLASFLRDELGSASEQPENRSAVSAESSQGNESSNLLATREAADSGNASDAATGQASFTPEEIGTGNEGAPATEACRPGFEALVRDRLAAIVARLGWSPAVGEDERTRQLRGEILRVQGTLGNDPATQETARARYARQRAGSEAVDSNVAAALVAICAHAGSEADYESFVAAFKGAATPQEEQRYLKALADFRDPALVGRTLAFALSGEVRTQDAPFLMRETLMGVHSREQAWLFVKEHWEAMERLFPSLTGLRRMCEGVTGLATPELEADVRRFFAERKISLGGKTLEQYLEQLRIAVAFREHEAAGLASYLSRRSGASSC